MRMPRISWAAGLSAALLITPVGPVVAQAAPPAAKPAAFAKCAMCHNVVKGGPNGIGPNLSGVVGRKAGSLATYSYSPSLAKAGLVWNRQSLDRYIADPKAIAPAGKMPAVTTTAAERAAIITYLAGLK